MLLISHHASPRGDQPAVSHAAAETSHGHLIESHRGDFPLTLGVGSSLNSKDVLFLSPAGRPFWLLLAGKGDSSVLFL